MSSSSEGGLRDSAALYEAIPDAIFSVDREGLVFALNHVAETLSGYSCGELIGQSVDVLVPDEYRADHAAHRGAFLKRLETREMGALSDIRLRHKGGEEVPVEVKLSPIGSSGESGVNCIVRDVRLARARETRLLQQAEHQTALATLGQRALSAGSLEPLFDDAVSTLADALDVEYCNVLQLLPGGEALLMVAGTGWREGLIGRETVGAGVHSQAGYALLCDDGVIVADLGTEDRFTGPPLLTEHGVVSGVSVIIRGMEASWGVVGAYTARRRDFGKEEVQFLQATANLLGMAIERERADEARRESEDRMRASQKQEAIGRLAGGIAHDFNNLLQIIMNSAERLDGEGRQRAAESIMSASLRAASLTRQLLAFGRQQVLQPRVLDLNAQISELEEMLCRVIGEDIELAMNLRSEIGNVRADPGQIHQVILNLAVNARDALPKGGQLTIETARSEIRSDEASSHSSLEPGPYTAIRVTDTGVGMDADTRSKVFEPFFTTKGESGTGLGLATVYGIVKQSGGSIRVASEEGHGTTFEILLPSVVLPVDAPDPADKRADGPHGAETVLVVEDDEAVRDAICLGLREHGYDVIPACDPSEAVEASERHLDAIDLLVTDMVMPGMRGSELLGHLRDTRPDLLAIVVSGYANDEGDESWRKEPDTSFLAKPFTSGQLARKVREVLDG